MKVLVQRVLNAQVTVAEKEVAAIENGLLLLVGFTHTDTEADVDRLVHKILQLRLFDNEQGVPNIPVTEAGGSILAVSQFTLYASTQKGNRPSYTQAAPPAVAQPLYTCFITRLEAAFGKPVACGIFGAHMLVHSVNNGPMTFMLESTSTPIP